MCAHASVVLYLLYTAYQNIHSTSNVLTFQVDLGCLRVQMCFEVGVRVGFRLGLASGGVSWDS